MGKLDGKVALITGASSGIGEATAIALAKEGASVGLAARRGDRLGELAGKIEADGGKALPVEVDVSDHARVEAMIGEVTGSLGGLHILVNNAGVMLLGPVDGGPLEEWRTMVDVNILGLLYCTREAMPAIRDSGGGHIVNVSSVAGRTASLGSGVYNFTKWGVTGFSEALRQEALHSKIRVTCIEPGFVAHGAPEPQQEPDGRRAAGEVPRPSGRRARGRGHRRGDPILGHPARARQRERDPGSADGPAALDAPATYKRP